jgi:hypothetical protein
MQPRFSRLRVSAARRATQEARAHIAAEAREMEALSQDPLSVAALLIAPSCAASCGLVREAHRARATPLIRAEFQANSRGRVMARRSQWVCEEVIMALAARITQDGSSIENRNRAHLRVVAPDAPPGDFDALCTSDGRGPWIDARVTFDARVAVLEEALRDRENDDLARCLHVLVAFRRAVDALAEAVFAVPTDLPGADAVRAHVATACLYSVDVAGFLADIAHAGPNAREGGALRRDVSAYSSAYVLGYLVPFFDRAARASARASSESLRNVWSRALRVQADAVVLNWELRA